jgi:hypothetical protein
VSSPFCVSLQQFPMPGNPPPSLLSGSLGSVRHLSSGTMGLLRLPLLLTWLFVFLRVTLTSLPPLVFARCGSLGFPPAAPGALVGRSRPFAPAPLLGRSQTDLSSSQLTLRCLCPVLRPRSDLHAKPFVAFQCCPRCSDYEGSNDDHCFEAQSHGFSIRSIRFVPTSLPTTQCLLLVGG